MKVLGKKGPLTKKQLSEIIGVSIGSVWDCLNTLLETGDIVREKHRTNEKGQLAGNGCYVFMIKQEETKK